MTLRPYDRQAAVEYAHRWAYFRNPNYYNFDELGGDCTNFASQCLYAGAGVMNFTPTFGWYYVNVNNRAPAWTGVRFFTTSSPGARRALAPSGGRCQRTRSSLGTSPSSALPRGCSATTR